MLTDEEDKVAGLVKEAGNLKRDLEKKMEEVNILKLANKYFIKFKLSILSILNQKEGEYRRQGLLCKDGPYCLYAEMLTEEEGKVASLVKEVGNLKRDLVKKIEELNDLKSANMNIITEVQRIAVAEQNYRLQVTLHELLKKEGLSLNSNDHGDSDSTIGPNDQNLGTISTSPSNYRGCLSPASLADREATSSSDKEDDFNRSSEVEEVEIRLAENWNSDGNENVNSNGDKDTDACGGGQASSTNPQTAREPSEAVGVCEPEFKDQEAGQTQNEDTLTQDYNDNRDTDPNLELECILCGKQIARSLEVATNHLAQVHHLSFEMGVEEGRSTQAGSQDMLGKERQAKETCKKSQSPREDD